MLVYSRPSSKLLIIVDCLDREESRPSLLTLVMFFAKRLWLPVGEPTETTRLGLDQVLIALDFTNLLVASDLRIII